MAYPSVTISAFSADALGSYQRIMPLGGGSGRLDNQVARVLAYCACSGTPSGTTVLRFKLVDTSSTAGTRTCLGQIEATLSFSSATTVSRTGDDGSSGNYIATVAFPNGSDTLDLLGIANNDAYQWYVGCPSAAPTNVTSITLSLVPTQVI